MLQDLKQTDKNTSKTHTIQTHTDPRSSLRKQITVNFIVIVIVSVFLFQSIQTVFTDPDIHTSQFVHITEIVLSIGVKRNLYAFPSPVLHPTPVLVPPLPPPFVIFFVRLLSLTRPFHLSLLCSFVPRDSTQRLSIR